MGTRRLLADFKRAHNADRYGVCLFSYGQVEVSFTPHIRGSVWIDFIQVNPDKRSGGHGSRTLRQICSWADKYGITLALRASRYDDGPLSTARLKKWYRSYGFRFDLRDNGTRLPT